VCVCVTLLCVCVCVCSRVLVYLGYLLLYIDRENYGNSGLVLV
jgi:hypothetical protein